MKYNLSKGELRSMKVTILAFSIIFESLFLLAFLFGEFITVSIVFICVTAGVVVFDLLIYLLFKILCNKTPLYMEVGDGKIILRGYITKKVGRKTFEKRDLIIEYKDIIEFFYYNSIVKTFFIIITGGFDVDIYSCVLKYKDVEEGERNIVLKGLSKEEMIEVANTCGAPLEIQ